MYLVPVAEDYSQIDRSGAPSLSRRGGIRLHPLRDGVIPWEREPGRLLHRDSGGNVYQEVTNPATGMCQAVTSPLTIEGGPVLEPTPVVPVHNPTRDAGILPQLDANTGVWYIGTGNSRRALRTVGMGDAALPSIPPRTGRGTPTTTAQRASRGADGASGRPGSPTVNRLPQALIDAYIQGLAERKAGRKLPPVKITKLMRKLARLELARQQDIRQYCDEVSK